MKRIGIIIGFLFWTCAAFGQTLTVSGVMNGASYAPGTLPPAGIAQGSVFVVKGTNLGPAVGVSASLPLPNNLGGTVIHIFSGTQGFQPLMLFSSAGQITAVMPSTIPVGSANITVTYNGAFSAPTPVQIVQSSFGALTLNQGGTGAALITDGNYNLITALNPATPNQQVVLWGTGLGAISPITADESQGPPAVNLNVPVQVYVGTTQANIVYRGRSGCCAGLDQINFTIPAGQIGCNVSVVVKINNAISNFTTMAISNGGPCSDPDGFSSSLLQQLATKGNINIGSIFLSRTTTNITLPPPTNSGTTMVDFGSAAFYGASQNAFKVWQSTISEPSPGSCIVSTFLGQPSSTPPATSFAGLDAGQLLTITGPSGSRQLNQVSQSPGNYSAILSTLQQGPFLGRGNYTISGAGGANVGAFQSSISETPVSWSNSDIMAVNRSQDLSIQWTGGAANTFVTISGTSFSGIGSTSPGASFVCIAPTSAGHFTVPSFVLLALPPSGQTGSQGSAQPTSYLYVGGSTYNSTTISGLDQAIVGYTDSMGVQIPYQ